MDEPQLRKDPVRKSKKLKFQSFTSYFRNSKLGDLISSPTNFEKKDLVLDNTSPHVIQECPFDVTGYGNLIMKDKFKMKKPFKKNKVLVFMFERIIIFTTEEKADLFYYLGSIQMSNLSMAVPTKKNKILLIDYSKNRNPDSKQHNFVYKLKTKNEETAAIWRDAIQKCLWKELLTAREKSLENILDHV